MRLDRRALLAAFAAAGAAPLFGRGPASYPPPDREAMLPVPGGRVYVRVNGDPTGPRAPVVFVHGGPGGTHAGYLDALALADERAVILYDQLDSGRSERPGDRTNWRIRRFVDELDAVRRGLGVARWHVVGHSWGGTVALEYGARRAAALASLVLASPLVSTRSWIADADALRATLPVAVRDEITRCETLPAARPPSCETATEAFYATFNYREPASEGKLAYRRAQPGLTGNELIYREMWGSSEFVATGTLKDYDGEPLLAGLDGTRTLFIGGQYDEARPVTLAGFAARVPGAELAIVPGAAHSLFGDRPTETIGLLRGWCARKDAA